MPYAFLAPVPVASAPAASPGVVQSTLSNGMRVVVLPDHLAPVATTVMVYAVGSNDDTMPGIAHATEHMMYRGTGDVSAAQFADIANRMGAQYNATTNNEFTYFYFKLPSSYLDLALHLEADRMTGASMRATDWATERKAIEQEVLAHEGQPGAKTGAKLSVLFYGAGSVLAQPTVGTVPSFEKMTAADIAAFYKSWYHPNDATLVVSGDVDPQRVLDDVHEQFDAIPSGTPPQHASLKVPPLAAAEVSDTIDLPFSIGALLFRAPGATSPDYAAALVLEYILASGRGPLADLSASGKTLFGFNQYAALPESGSSFIMAVPARGSSARDAAGYVEAALAQYRQTGVPHDLVDAARQRLLADRAYANASISGLAFAWAYAVAQRQESATAVYDALAGVTDDDVDRMMRTYYAPDHQITALMQATSTLSPARVDPNAAVENVAYKPTTESPLPAWAASGLSAPPRVPQRVGTDVTNELPNGLTVVVRRETESPTVTVTGEIVTSAELYEPEGREGVESLTSRLQAWGTLQYDRKAYETQFDDIAANASLGNSFGLTVGAQNFDRGMQLLADGMLHPAFPKDGFDVLKAQMVQASAAADALPATRAQIAETDALYPPGDPRRRRATAASIASIGLGDVRRWYAFSYRPDLTTIAIVGDVTPEQARAVVSKYFGDWRAFGKMPSFAFPAIPQRAVKSETITVKSASARQSAVTLKQAFDLGRNDRDYAPLLLANTMLSGEGTGSLLFSEVRTHRGYVYDISSAFAIDRDHADFTVSYESNPGDVDRAQAAVVAVLERLRTTSPPASDLERAKALLVASLVLPLDSYGGVASQLLSDEEYGTTAAASDRFWRTLLATTPQQISDAMRRHVHPNRFLRVIVAPGG